jgi:hypothetical protein
MSCEPAPADFICALLSTDYQDLINCRDNIDVLTASAKRIIHENATALRGATQRCHLDVFLSAMLDHAPHPQGRRYVAVVLRAASKQGSGAVVEVAEAWMDCFFQGQLLVKIRFYRFLKTCKSCHCLQMQILSLEVQKAQTLMRHLRGRFDSLI